MWKNTTTRITSRRLLHSQQCFFSTTTTSAVGGRGGETITPRTAATVVDVVSHNNSHTNYNHNKNHRRISLTLYRQLLRWCVTVQQQKSNGVPDGILRYFFPHPFTVTAPDDVDSYRMKLLYNEAATATSSAPPPPSQTHHDDSFALLPSCRSSCEVDVVAVRRVYTLLPPQTQYHHHSKQQLQMTIPVHTMTDLKNCIRALFRLNSTNNNVAVNVAPDAAIHPQQDVDNTSAALLQQQEEEYQRKRRRTMAFDNLKILNEFYVDELVPLMERHQQHTIDRSHVQFTIGQIVQHRRERWRGIVIGWEKKKQNTKGSLIQLHDDFSKTSLTTKSYDNLFKSDDKNNNNNNNNEDVVMIHVLLDAGDVPNVSSSSTTNGWTTTEPQSNLCTVTDYQLCRIRNVHTTQFFTRYDHRSHRFIPNLLKSYEFPSDDYNDSINDKGNSDDSSSLPVQQQDQQQQSNTTLDKKEEQAVQQYHEICNNVISGVQDFATTLQSGIHGIVASRTTSTTLNSIFLDPLQAMSTGQLRSTTTHRIHNDEDPGIGTIAAMHVQALLSLSHTVLETMRQRRIAMQQMVGRQLHFTVGDVVQHTKYGYRGVVVAWDPIPTVNVTQWDGLQDIEHVLQKPFYHIVPDQQDCIDVFGGERPMRYVCQDNLESCPRENRRTTLNVDLDPGWDRLDDDSYRPPELVRFKYGDVEDEEDGGGMLARSMELLESRINQWQCQAQQQQNQNGGIDNNDNAIQQHPNLSLSYMMCLLQTVDNLEDAVPVQDMIKEMRKAHVDIDIRSKLEQGIVSIVAGNTKSAYETYLTLVQTDPTYAEGWNKLATCEYMMGKHEDAIRSTLRVLELDPTHYQAWNGLGLLRIEKREYNDAVQCFRKSLDMDPWSPVSSKLSYCLDKMNNTDRA